MPRSRFLVCLVVAAVIGTASCATGDPEAGAPGTVAVDTRPPPGGPCPVAPVPVVVSVDQWRDLVQDLGGQCAAVTTVLAGSAADPHEYELTPADRFRFDGAGLVVINGLGYDTWAEDAVAARRPPPPVVRAADAAGAAPDDNPHQWYSPAGVGRVGPAVTAELGRLLPGAEAYLDERAATWRRELDLWLGLVAEVRGRHAGRTYAATEPVAAPLAQAVGLRDLTPPGYAAAAASGSDPAPGDLAAFRTALAEQRIDVLIVNTQTEGSVPSQLRAAAEAAGVPVVEVTETVPPGQRHFVTWQVDQLRRLDRALGGPS